MKIVTPSWSGSSIKAKPSEPEDPRLTIWSFIADEELANHPASRETAKGLEELYDNQEGLTIDETRKDARKIFQENGTDGSQGAPAWRAPEDVDEIIASFIDHDNFDERSLYFIAHAADAAAGSEDGGIGVEPGPGGGDGRMDLS